MASVPAKEGDRAHQPPLTDGAAAGGWKNTQTLLTRYHEPDEDTLRRVLDEPRKLRDRGLDGADRPPAAPAVTEKLHRRRHLTLGR